MLRRLTVLLFLVLLAKEFKSTDGYAFPIRKEGFVTACVSDETPVAFVKDSHDRNDDTTVDVVDLNGNAIPLADHDCNLVRERGCEKWNLNNGWEEQGNMRGLFDPFPMVTDYRWNDFPGIFASDVFKNKIKITKNQNTKMYFSILAHDTVQFLFTSDSTLDSGCNAVIDGWNSLHKSVLRKCSKINGTVDAHGDIWPICEAAYRSEEGHDVLKEGKKWAHVTLEITFDESDGSDSLIIGENIYIKFSAHSSCIREEKDSDLYVSFRSSKSKRGLFKIHDYSIIQPVEASSSMEVRLEEDSTSSFCVDVVFLTNERITLSDKTLFSVWVTDATGSKRFDKTVQSTGNFWKWTTERFEKWDVTLKKGWKIILTAHDTSLVIGGVKFCKKGDLVTKTKMNNVTNCYPLVQQAENQTPDKNFYNQLLHQIGECKAFGGNCYGYKLCYTQDDCTCFAGYQRDNCTTTCEVGRFGQNCSYTSRKNCFEDKFNYVDGTCVKGCKVGYQPSLCEKECTGYKYGLHCSKTSNRACLNGGLDRIDGTCLQGCAAGFMEPHCNQSCQGKNFGLKCSSVSTKKCSGDRINHVDGNCLNGCAEGFLPPQCETVLDYHGTDGNLFEIRQGDQLEACVSDSPTIAFVQNTSTTMTDFVRVEAEDLHGNAIPLSQYDCNLAVEKGCESWNQTGWENMPNTFYDFPMVTDYRWNDLPVFIAMERFNKKINFTNHKNLKMHFSILATDSAQFLFTKDPNLDEGFQVVLDGWNEYHKSVLGFCTNFQKGQFPAFMRKYQTIWGNALLSGGMKWAHATLAITFNTTDEDYKDTLTVNYIAKIDFRPKRELYRTEYYVSFRAYKNCLFKLHEYQVLRSLKSPSLMILTLRESSSSAFCVDVVYLSDKRSHGNSDMFSLELKDERGASKYKESVASKDYFEWTTARFRSDKIKLGNYWKLTLTAHVKSVVIGGVRFCKEGELVFKRKVGNPTICHSLEKKARDDKAIPDEHFNELLYELSESKSFKGGSKLCERNNTNCTCFAGFEGPSCKSCKDNRYGIGCSKTTRKHCSENKINQRNGNCLIGCATGYYSPQCEEQCTGGTYGENCSTTSNRICLDGKFSHLDGQCLQGCEIGFYAPECLKANKQSHVLTATLILVPLIFALLALIGVWIYFKNRRKPEQTFNEASVKFTKATSETCTAEVSPFVEENHGDE